VRAGALRFMSNNGIELWALYNLIQHYHASWDTEPRNYLSMWKLPVDPRSPHADELFPNRLPNESHVAPGAGLVQNS
jgi:hypothetical protein